ncbi:glycoside hydrolase family 3 C-terminal domain-containing protein, partial [candidate division KSB1 bacterium]|nr:glycoside hydrolase family 3 C-terminal domain-containing protein [candidate division KSB1 bacterium]
NPYPDKSMTRKFAGAEFAAVNLECAREAMTLLKNDKNLLPLPKSVSVLLTGPNADRRSAMNGGWSIIWQGNREDLYPTDKPTVLGALQETLGEEHVTFVPGSTVDKEIDIAAAVEAARDVDVIIACLGEDAYCETPGNINDLTLPEAQLRLVQALQETGKPVALVLIEGRPRVVREIVGGSQAILMAYLPGLEGGRAIVDVLFGDYNPCGKLPITYPQYPNDLTLYDHTYAENCNSHCRYHPQWPFGYGLSYTTFEYSDLQLDRRSIEKGDELKVSVTVTNSGTVAGKETVQLYVGDVVASLTPPVKRLKRFDKILLQSGEAKTVTFTLTTDDLAFFNWDNKPVVEPGDFIVTVGSLRQTFNLK